MATSYTSLLGLALPVTGELQGTWGDVVNDSITSLLDNAVAGTTTISTDVDVTLTTTTGAANQARQAIILCSGARTAIRTITAPARSKIYTVINATTGGFDVKIVGVGPTTGISIPAGTSATLAWNGSDFIDATTFFNANPRFGGGTANGVAYLNGSKVLTTGGALTFDGTNLIVSGDVSTASGNLRLTANDKYIGFLANGMYINNTTDQVYWKIAGSERMRLTSTGLGIGTSSPGTRLNVQGTQGAEGAMGIVSQMISTTAYNASPIAGISLGTAYNVGGSVAGMGGIAVGKENATDGNYAGYLALYTRANGGSTTERARIDSFGNLGIGTSTPSAKLDVAISGGMVRAGGASGNNLMQVYTGTNGLGLWAGGSTRLYTTGGLTFSVNSTLTTGAPTGYTDAMTLDASGNLGLGVTPSAWGTASTGRAIEVGVAGSLSARGTTSVEVAGNAYYNGTNWIYRNTNPASNYSQSAGAHSWNVAASGAAGATITFTQAMTLNASGNLSVGTTSSGARVVVADSANAISTTVTNGGILLRELGGSAANNTVEVNIRPNAGKSGYLTFTESTIADRWSIGIANGDSGLRFVTGAGGGGTERMRLDSSGNLGLGVTPSASTLKMLQGPADFVLATQANGLYLANSAYYNAGWKYASGSAPSRFTQDNGSFQWHQAAAGAAGTAITFTQAMTLDASGRLGIGTASPGYKLDVNGSVRLGGNLNTDADSPIIFDGGTFTLAAAATQTYKTQFEIDGSTTYINSNQYYSGGSWQVYDAAKAPAAIYLSSQNTDSYIGFRTSTVNSGQAVERMRLDKFGNLGIGTSTPGAKLQVSGSPAATSGALAILRDTSATGVNNTLGSVAFTSGPGTDFYIGKKSESAVGSLSFGNAGTGAELMRLDSSGNLGIGTNAPSATLDVNGTIAITGSARRITGDFSNATVANRAMFQTSTVNSATVIAAIPNGTSTTTALQLYPNTTGVNTGFLNILQTSTDVSFQADRTGTGTYLPMTFFTGGSERMRLDTSGNLGIGTSSPGQKLVTASSATNSKIEIQNTSTAASTSKTSALQFSGTDTVGTLKETGNIYVTPADNNYVGSNMLFYTRGSDSVNERARIDSSGQSGWGSQPVPGVRMAVFGGGTTGATYSFSAYNSSGFATLSVRDDGVIYTGTRAFSPYNNTTGSAANMFVGVNGDLYRSTSSLKYKTDVQDATHGLAQVMQLRPVTYKGKNDGDLVFGGLIAEEVHEVGLTEFVQYAEDGTPDALAYANMVSLAFKAIQEQQAIINQLKARLDAANL